MSSTDTYECPCRECNKPTLDPDAVCTACMHAGCGYEARCTDTGTDR